MATNLLEVLPKEDKELLKQYIELYVTAEGVSCDIDYYLRFWAASKTKLYHLLGNKLQVKIPYKQEMSHELKRISWKNYFQKQNIVLGMALSEFRAFCDDCPLNLTGDDKRQLRKIICALEDSEVWINDEIGCGCKIKLPNDKTFQIDEKMKPVKVFIKCATFINEQRQREIISTKVLEEFRVLHSMWKTEHFLQGNLVFSIHPMDFVTMSDNASNWKSCMSWINDGCYKLGTVEMMNSNNVMCVYLESTTQSLIIDKQKSLKWNNKKWRELFYITKDIIVGGEQYPYENTELTQFALNCLRQMARENMHWGYEFGPELYKDMQYVTTLSTIDNIKSRRYCCNERKNIIFDTRAMYNDLMHKNNHYYCVRNKIKKNKVISLSGKTVCACCGDVNSIGYDYDYYADDNCRNDSPNQLVCSPCQDTYSCPWCEHFAIPETLREIVTIDDEYRTMCPRCLEKKAISCPCCGVMMDVANYQTDNVISIKTPFYNPKIKSCYVLREQLSEQAYYAIPEITIEDYYKSNKPDLIYLYACPDCRKEFLKQHAADFETVELRNTLYSWQLPLKFNMSTKTFTLEEILANPEYSKMLFYHKALI